jgi:uncharacterized protein (DUF427 family)
MTVRAVWNDAIIAESNRTVLVEGNHYFPPEDVRTEFLEPSVTTTHCTWKGDASYFTILVGNARNGDAGWCYLEPYDRASEIAGYVAFWKGVEATGENANEPEIRPPLSTEHSDAPIGSRTT